MENEQEGKRKLSGRKKNRAEERKNNTQREIERDNERHLKGSVGAFIRP